MDANLQAVLDVVGTELDVKAERVAGFLRNGSDPQTAYEALVLALVLMDPAEVLDLAFAGVVYVAKAKLAAQAAVNATDV